jgi:TPR repeat protein
MFRDDVEAAAARAQALADELARIRGDHAVDQQRIAALEAELASLRPKPNWKLAVVIGLSAAAFIVWLRVRDPQVERNLTTPCFDGNTRACLVACQEGYPYACLHQALRDEKGEGGPKNLARAETLNLEACERGLFVACSNVGSLVEDTDPERAVTLYRHACDGKEPAGCNNLGAAYSRGLGSLDVDEAQAMALYERACGQDHQRACSNLAALLVYGKMVPHDPARARKLAATACDKGVARACDTLGYLRLHP